MKQEISTKIKPAGTKLDTIEDHLDKVLSYQLKVTPEKLKKFRKTSLLELGKTTLNSRNYDHVKKFDQNKVFGIKSNQTESVENIMNQKATHFENY